MPYANDKLYNDLVKKMMAHLASVVKVREIIPHLPCLTLTDREEIEAKRETAGNYSAMILLLDCLRRRENWPEEFISALQACEHWTLAKEIGDTYDTIRGINRSATTAAPPAASLPGLVYVPASADPVPASTPASALATTHVPAPVPALAPAAATATTFTTATIHNAPCSTNPLLTPSPPEAPAPAGDPAHIQSPQESYHSITAAAADEAPASVLAPAPPPLEPTQPSEPPAPVTIHDARPHSPVSSSKVTVSFEQNEVFLNSGAAPTLNCSDDLTCTAVSESPSAAATSLPTNTVISSLSQPNTPCISSHFPDAPEESKIPLAVIESSASVKSPIQDTNPPEKLNEKVPITVSQNSPAQTAPPETALLSPSTCNDAVAANLSHTAAAGEEYFSKPGILMGTEPSLDSSDDLQISHPPTETTGSSPVQPARPLPSHLQPMEQSEEPCSVNSDELMFSGATDRITDASLTQASQHPPIVSNEVPTEPACVSHPTAPENVLPHSTPEENSFPEGDTSLSQNQPVEDHYESYSQSLQGEPGTLVNVVQFSEEPSILNLNGQPPTMTGSAIHRNDKPVSLDCTSLTESPIQSVVTEDQPTIHNQGIAQCTQRKEIHTSEQAAPAVDVFVSAEPTTHTCQESGLNASRLVNTHQSQQREDVKEYQGVLSQLQPDLRLIAAAGAISIAAVLMAWKYKH